MGVATILVVEDSVSQAEAVKTFLEQSGYEVHHVEDGKSAIREAVGGKVDLILLDLVLPDMSGVEVCRWLKLNRSTRMIPILMLTSKAEVQDRVSGLEAGAEDYLSKPYSEMELNARIFALLRTKALQDELSETNARLQELLADVEMLARTDPLTKLYNRRHIQECVDREIKSAWRYGSPLCLLMIDIDRFKEINDGHGHRCGDSVLAEISCIIRDSVREVDIVGRWGGEEFVVVLPRCAKQDAEQLANRILHAVAQNEFSAVPDAKVTVSIGVASIPEQAADNSDALLDAADRAMYMAKKEGRNKVYLF
ncbi:MAG: diguanylate cyclase [Nitrospirota bacterium]|jgi:two-component system cell cycle response regulator